MQVNILWKYSCMSQTDFDSVDHSILIGKYGDSLKWLKSYLSNRFTYVKITYRCQNNREFKISSELQPISIKVTLSSILGPLLFLCYFLKNRPCHLTYAPHLIFCVLADDDNFKFSTKSLEVIKQLLSQR